MDGRGLAGGEVAAVAVVGHLKGIDLVFTDGHEQLGELLEFRYVGQLDLAGEHLLAEGHWIILHGEGEVEDLADEEVAFLRQAQAGHARGLLLLDVGDQAVHRGNRFGVHQVLVVDDAEALGRHGHTGLFAVHHGDEVLLHLAHHVQIAKIGQVAAHFGDLGGGVKGKDGGAGFAGHVGLEVLVVVVAGDRPHLDLNARLFLIGLGQLDQLVIDLGLLLENDDLAGAFRLRARQAQAQQQAQRQYDTRQGFHPLHE